MPDPIRGVGTTDPIIPAGTTQTGTAQSTGETDAANAAATTTGTSGPSADLADVSQTENLLQTIIQAASATPGIDQTKVTELQQAIASGAYQANPQAIAQKIVELEGLLGTAGNLQ